MPNSPNERRGHPGSPGQPGQPGQPGTEGQGGWGGAGGTGGEGGLGGIGGVAAGKELQQGLRRLSYATIGLFVVLVFLGGYFKYDSVQKDHVIQNTASISKERADDTNKALCALKNDLVVRIRTTQEFLAEHPKGTPGIPAASFKQSIANQQRTVDALTGDPNNPLLDCEEVNGNP
jgi:hypothetical protein